MSSWFADLPLFSVILLLCSGFLGSLLTAAVGVGGGAFLIAVMAGVLPPVALIPLHGIVQLGSNSTRAWLTRKHTQWHKIGWFALGAGVASLFAVFLLGKMEPGIIPLLVGLFILWLSWGKIPEIGLGDKPAGLLSGGLITTLLTMLVGATGPLVSAWLGRAGTDRWQYTANFSSCMTLQHLLKAIVFGMAGFAFMSWIPLLVAMIGCGYLGTRVGLKLMGKMPEAWFRQAFRWVLTLLSLRLIWIWWMGQSL